MIKLTINPVRKIRKEYPAAMMKNGPPKSISSMAEKLIQENRLNVFAKFPLLGVLVCLRIKINLSNNNK
jgi:hypothetical protein